jgi:hypothetical protein
MTTIPIKKKGRGIFDMNRVCIQMKEEIDCSDVYKPRNVKGFGSHKKVEWGGMEQILPQKTNPGNTLISDSSLQNSKRIHFSCAKHQVCGNLFCQP